MKPLSHQELHEFLELKYLQYNTPSFIESDPVSVPHQFSKKEDIEIAGFLTATISWGTRTGILKNANDLLRLMDLAPHDFIMNFDRTDLKPFESFVHRTFNGMDCIFFLRSLKNIYKNHQGLERVFTPAGKSELFEGIISFRRIFLESEHDPHVEKHLANPAKNASAKRILMFLRWMVRNDPKGVDFGLWKGISPGILMCPIDVHSGTVARKLGLLRRKSDDWKAVAELTGNLRKFDPADPVKYDFALFGLGVFEKF